MKTIHVFVAILFCLLTTIAPFLELPKAWAQFQTDIYQQRQQVIQAPATLLLEDDTVQATNSEAQMATIQSVFSLLLDDEDQTDPNQIFLPLVSR